MLWGLLSLVLAFQFSASRHVVKDLAANCQVNVADGVYNLCSLSQIAGDFVEYELSTKFSPQRLKYRMNIVGNDTDSEGDQCPPGMWLCINALNIRGHTPRHFQIAGIFDPEHPPYETAGYDLADHQAQILFFCAHDTQEPSRPVFTGEVQGVHMFTWTTYHACTTARKSPTLSVNEEEAPAPDDSKEGAEDGQELMDPLPISDSHRRSIVTIFLLTAFVLIILGFVFYSTATPVRHFAAIYLKPISFGTREGRIVRWAQEDMGFLENEEDDIMVNGGMNEQIPLKQSPRHDRRFFNYGNAP